MLIGVGRGDTEVDAVHLAGKTSRLRIFSDTQEQMNLSVDQIDGDFLAVSQFTLYADCRRGNRPSYSDAAEPGLGQKLYDRYVEELQGLGCRVATGIFGAKMLVELENDGPVTVMLERSGR